MPATDRQGPSKSLNYIGRSILSRHREQVYSMDAAGVHDAEIDEFQRKVTERFFNISAAAGNDNLLSIAWIRKLLDDFLCCQEEFRVILFNNSSTLGKSPADRLMEDFFERIVKALDVCNAIRDGIEQIRHSQKFLEIVLCALDNNQRSLGEGQFRRAKKALSDLETLLDEKDSGTAVARRNRSFGSNNGSPRDHHRRSDHSRSLSWNVSRPWSAARQLQAIGNNLTAPKANEILATSGLAVAIFTMSSVLLFVMWTLVAAIPCQGRGLNVHFSVPRHFTWAAPMLSLHERILEESKKRERRNSCGLLKEVQQIERCARSMNEMVGSVQFPLTKEKEIEARQKVQKLGLFAKAVKEGLDPLERQVRDVFHRIVRSRTEGLSSFGRTDHND